MQGMSDTVNSTAPTTPTLADARDAVLTAWLAMEAVAGQYDERPSYEHDETTKLDDNGMANVVAIVHELVSSDEWRLLTVLHDYNELHALPELCPWLRTNLQAYLNNADELNDAVRQSVQTMLTYANRQHRAVQYADAIWNGLSDMVNEYENTADGDMLVMLVARELAAVNAPELWYGMNELADKASAGWTVSARPAVS
jgi:hypothetical protein